MMADVQISQTPSSGSGSGAWVWGLIVLILLGVIAWFVFGGGLHKTTTAKVDINVPGAVSPSAPSSGGTAGGSVPPATSSPTKKP
jgi:hypothetical protein